MIRLLARFVLRVLYGFRAYNESVLSAPGPVLLLPNHVSWWDWLLIGACLDDDWRFATSSTSAETSWLHKRIMVNRRTFPVDMASPYALKHMAEYLQRGGRLVLFPEGRISYTASLMKLFDGTGFLLAKTKSKVITAYIPGCRPTALFSQPGPETVVSSNLGPFQPAPDASAAGAWQRDAATHTADRLAAVGDDGAAIPG